MKFFALLLVLSTFAHAETIDERLRGYITKFNLANLPALPAKNKELFDLGHELFETNLISGNNNISCRDCHHPAAATMDGLPLGLGEGAAGINTASTSRTQKNGHILARNTPALFNLNGINSMFWDARVEYDPTTHTFKTPVVLRPEVAAVMTSALAAQAIFPMVDHLEMRGGAGSNMVANARDEYEAWDLIVQKVMADPDFRARFEKVFPGQTINIGHFGEAIAEFQRHAFAFNQTPYDDYLRGDDKALTEIQKLGMEVFFNKGKCGECHSGAYLSNFEYHNIGVAQIGPGKNNGDDKGRAEVTGSHEDMYAFRVPQLRNVGVTAPYMHDGTFKTIGQVVEHYDDVVASLTEFALVNNWKNYVDAITDHDHAHDQHRISHLSKKLTAKLGFLEEEEKALAEFVGTALTDKRFLAAEIEGDYQSYFRFQLKESGFNKLSALFSGEKHEETFYYFDLIFEGGFGLRGLATPIRLIVVKNPEGAQLVYRQQIYKSAFAAEGKVLESNFNRWEYRTVDPSVFAPMEEAYLDMFNRIYTYNNGEVTGDIPAAELSVIKSDLDIMNGEFHKTGFNGLDAISDIVNLPKEKLYFVPTSYNAKDVNLFELQVMGKTVKANLQRSVIRTETGGLQTTWAIELETGKISKRDLARFSEELMKALPGLEANDVGGGSPSPSALTLKVINQVL
ncbi:MAG: cytochrome-c peroxidase [Bacteriovoracaceae bacterium]